MRIEIIARFYHSSANFLSLMNHTLLNYTISERVAAFSTTRISPFSLQEEDILQMGNYAAFNVTDYCGDDFARVKQNKEWLCRELNIENEQLWLPRQTHTDNVIAIDAPFLSLPQEQQKQNLQEIDALLTNLPQQCIGVSTADCVPILVYDEAHQAIAAIHAGWRGTIKRIAEKALQEMEHRYGTTPADCKAVIGPSISLEAFEVGEEVAEQFLCAGFPASIINHSYAKPHIDLWAANVVQLEALGMNLANIQIAGICTYQHSDTFFSARRLGIKSGRIFTAIMIK